MLYAPMKPVGTSIRTTTGPRDGEFKTPYAVVQLRQDAAGSLYNIVGFRPTSNGVSKKRVFK